jgi:hypothetical protein
MVTGWKDDPLTLVDELKFTPMMCTPAAEGVQGKFAMPFTVGMDALMPCPSKRNAAVPGGWFALRIAVRTVGVPTFNCPGNAREMMFTAVEMVDCPTALVEAPKDELLGVKFAIRDATPVEPGVHVKVARELVDVPTGFTAAVAMMFCDGKSRRVMVPVGASDPAGAATVARTEIAVFT